MGQNTIVTNIKENCVLTRVGPFFPDPAFSCRSQPLVVVQFATQLTSVNSPSIPIAVLLETILPWTAYSDRMWIAELSLTVSPGDSLQTALQPAAPKPVDGSARAVRSENGVREQFPVILELIVL